jgi:hypothetical protein
MIAGAEEVHDPLTQNCTFDDPSKPEYIVYKVVRFTGNLDAISGDTAHVERDPNEAAVEDELVHHSWSEYMAGAAPHGAPWKTVLTAGTRLAGRFRRRAGSGRGRRHDDVAVYNDADPGNHTNDAGGSDPLGVEVQQTTFAFNRQGALGQHHLPQVDHHQQGHEPLDSMFTSIWSERILAAPRTTWSV